jgi:hypothetical protein
MQKSQKSDVVPCYDRSRQTCIQVARFGKFVKYIELDVSKGLYVQESSAERFDERYKPIVNYPAEKACQLFVGFSQNIGASEEALDYLGLVVNISTKEREMATKKQAATADAATAKAAKAAAAKPAKPAKPAAKAATKTTAEKATRPVAAKPAKAVRTGEDRKPTAAKMFQELIMAGKLTDDQIFDKVKAEFNLDEKKRGYVKWYRNYLKKQGQNPPEPKVAK